jgi:hypothetical protein
LKNHDLFKHFSFFIVNSKILKENLFSNENYYINLLKDLKMNLINEKNRIPDKKYIQFKKIGDFL